MSTATEIEKKNLETHVELCAQRYMFLEQKLESVEKKVSDLEIVLREVHDLVADHREQRTSQLINWGIGIMTVMGGVIAWLVSNYILKI